LRTGNDSRDGDHRVVKLEVRVGSVVEFLTCEKRELSALTKARQGKKGNAHLPFTDPGKAVESRSTCQSLNPSLPS
jgi:hypothetical protein